MKQRMKLDELVATTILWGILLYPFVLVISSLLFWGVAGYVGIHFLLKYW